MAVSVTGVDPDIPTEVTLDSQFLRLVISGVEHSEATAFDAQYDVRVFPGANAMELPEQYYPPFKTQTKQSL